MATYMHNRCTVHERALPSVCMYTLLNCADSLNGADVSVDGSILAACLADSTGSTFSKVLSIVTLHIKCIRGLTFKNILNSLYLELGPDNKRGQ